MLCGARKVPRVENCSILSGGRFNVGGSMRDENYVLGSDRECGASCGGDES